MIVEVARAPLLVKVPRLLKTAVAPVAGAAAVARQNAQSAAGGLVVECRSPLAIVKIPEPGSLWLSRSIETLVLVAGLVPLSRKVRLPSRGEAGDERCTTSVRSSSSRCSPVPR